MSEAAFASFHRDEAWKSFWELPAATWHNTFNDSPADARAFAEHRLFGEKARFLTHAVLEQPEVFGDITPHLRKMYGDVKVYWINTCCTMHPLQSTTVRRRCTSYPMM